MCIRALFLFHRLLQRMGLILVLSGYSISVDTSLWFHSKIDETRLDFFLVLAFSPFVVIRSRIIIRVSHQSIIVIIINYQIIIIILIGGLQLHFLSIRKLVSAPEYDFTLERLECSGVFELWSAPAFGHSTHSAALTECVEHSGDLEYFYMSNSPTGTYPIAILCTHIHSIAHISKKYNSENDTYDIYGCIASVENIVKPYLSVFYKLSTTRQIIHEYILSLF